MLSLWIAQLTLRLMMGSLMGNAPAPAAHSLGTHAQITAKVVEYTVANGLTCQDPARARTLLDSLLQIGTREEDNWTESVEEVRAQIKTRTGRDIANHQLELLGQTLILGRFNFHFTPRLTDGGVDASCSSFQWAFGNQPCTYISLVPAIVAGTAKDLDNVRVTLTNQFDWAAAVRQAKQPAGATGFAQGFVSLGYVLHLFEDLTSPAHSRNDAHGWNDPEWMEYRMPTSLKEEWGVIEQFSGLPEEVRTPAMPQARPLPAEALTAPQLFQELHTHVSTHYFSKSTVAFKAPGPITHDTMAVSCAAAKGVAWTRYICDANGKMHAKGDVPISWTPGVIQQSRAITWPTQKWVDSYVADEQWKELGPLAVRYGARLVMNYIRTAAPLMPCTVK